MKKYLVTEELLKNVVTYMSNSKSDFKTADVYNLVDALIKLTPVQEESDVNKNPDEPVKEKVKKEPTELEKVEKSLKGKKF